MANKANSGIKNLIPPKKGEIRNPNGRTKGTVNKTTVLNYLLFQADMNELGVIRNKPEWWDRVKPKTMYEIMTLAVGIKAMGGDVNAFNAINNAISDQKGSTNVNVIFTNNVPRPAGKHPELPRQSEADIIPSE